MKAIELEKIILNSAVEGVMKMYNLDRETSEKLVDESGLEWTIKVSPDMIAHCSQEQLVDIVMK